MCTAMSLHVVARVPPVYGIRSRRVLAERWHNHEHDHSVPCFTLLQIAQRTSVQLERSFL